MVHLERGEYLSTTVVGRTFSSARIVETTYRAGQRLPRHAHAHVYLAVVVDGGLRETAGGREHELSRGRLVFNSAGEGHWDSVLAAETRVLNVEFQPRFLADALSGVRLSSPVCYSHAGPALPAVGRLHSALRDPDGELEAEQAFIELLEVLAQPREGRRAEPAWLARALEYVHASFRGPVQIREIAAAAAVHPTHLCRAFRAATGCTVGAYIRRLRADLAHRHLAAGVLPLAAVAAECGYADQSHMAREVRRHYDRSPARLRRGMR